MTASPPASRRFDWPVVAILILACAFRAYRLDAPFVDAHSWRQVTNADIARIWAEGRIDFLYPSVSWGGPDGRVGLEFPLLHLLIALVWKVVGISNTAGRVVPALFSVAGVYGIYRVGARLFGAPAGRAAAFLLAVSPTVVYFGRTPLSDTLMLTFSVFAVLGYLAYAQDGRRQDAVLGAASLALAGLVKLPAILVLGPALWTGLRWKGVRSTLADPWYVSTMLAAVGAIGVWYFHADRIYLETGLTQAIFRPSGTYASDIGQYAGVFTTVSHWTRRDLLTWETFETLAVRFYAWHLTPVFAVVTLAGLFSWRWPWRERSLVDIWMAAALSLVIVSLTGQLPHEFHQLPTLPPLALYFGMAAAPLFGGRPFTSMTPPMRRVAGALVGVALATGAVLAFRDSGVVQALYRPDTLNTALINAGEQIDALTPRDALLVTVEYEKFGTNSPMLLYFSHRKGWSFDDTSITPLVVEHLAQRFGACRVAVMGWQSLEAMRPDMTSWLLSRREVVLPDTHDTFRLFDVGCR